MEEKSNYQIYKERVQEGAKSLPKLSKETPQNILWLKSMAIERIEEIDKVTDDRIKTIRTRGREVISLSESMKPSDTPTNFSFTENYVNLLMHYAYEAGKRDVEERFKRSSAEMSNALKAIAEIIEDAGYGNDCENY
jgi:hypothetical protein